MTRASRDTALTTRAAPPALPLRDAQQHLVQPGWRRLPLRTPSGERTEPLVRPDRQAARGGGLINHGIHRRHSTQDPHLKCPPAAGKTCRGRGR
jgi:hypothetical protein